MRTKSGHVLELLRRYESQNVTFVAEDGSWPIVWQRAKGVHVWDEEWKRYLDFTAAFGVAAAGHGNSRVVEAGARQMAKLLHAMGDVHPHELKARLAQELSRLTFERWTRNSRRSAGKVIFCNSGFEAVEAALKTALLATGKAGIVAFRGAYHGTGYGALNATHRRHFRDPFERQLAHFGFFLPYPAARNELGKLERQLTTLFRREKIGAVLVEPVQARGGINVPPAEFLPMLRRVCDRARGLLILDEIYTGFGRTGRWFACEHRQTVPDLICLGKALTGGFPLSACAGRAELMDSSWPRSTGEAMHTSTFLGHPVGCAMALAQLKEIERKDLVRRSAAHGRLLLDSLKTLRPPSGHRLNARGLGLMAGLEITGPRGEPSTTFALETIKRMLRSGFLLLPEGEHSNVIGITPPLTISAAQITRMIRAMQRELDAERSISDRLIE